MKWWTMVLWVPQFGLSALFPLCAFLLIGAWLQNTYNLSPWFCVLCGIWGLLTSISTVRACYRAMRRDAEDASREDKKVPAYNDHD